MSSYVPNLYENSYAGWKARQKLKQIVESRPQKYIDGDLKHDDRIEWINKTEEMTDKEWIKYMTRISFLKEIDLKALQYYRSTYLNKLSNEYFVAIEQITKPGVYVGPTFVTNFWTPYVLRKLNEFVNDPIRLATVAAVSVASTTLRHKNDSTTSLPASITKNLIIDFLIWYAIGLLIFAIPLMFTIAYDLFWKIPSTIGHYLTRRYELANEIDDLNETEGSAKRLYHKFEKQHGLIMDAISVAKKQGSMFF